MGVAVGAVLRNQVAAVVGLLVWVLAVENIVSGLIPVTAKWFPFNGAAGSFSSQASDRLFDRPEAALLMAALRRAGLGGRRVVRTPSRRLRDRFRPFPRDGME